MRDGNKHRPLSRREVMLGAAAVGGAAAAGGLVGAPGTAAAATPQGLRASSPPQLGGFGDWLGSLVQVATVAANVLPMLIAVRAGVAAPDPYQAGGVQFEIINLDGQSDLYAHNISGIDAGLSYSITASEPSSNTSVYQPLPAKGAYKCDADLRDYVDGQVYVAPSALSTAFGPLTRSLSFAVRGLTIAAVVNVVNGVKVSVTKDPGTGTFSAAIETTGTQKALRAQIAATGPDGNVVRAQWDASTQGQPADGTIEIPFPVGVNLDPVVQLLELYLDLDSAGLDQATAERRSRVILL